MQTNSLEASAETSFRRNLQNSKQHKYQMEIILCKPEGDKLDKHEIFLGKTIIERIIK